MNRYEKILRVPCLVVTRDLALKVGEEIHNLGEQRIDIELRNRLQGIYRNNPAAARALDPGAIDEASFIQRNLQNDAYRALIVPGFAERYTFLSKRGNVQFVGDDWELAAIPKDVDAVMARADGPTGNFIDVSLKARFVDFNDRSSDNVNRIIVQGDDLNWVNRVHEGLKDALEPEASTVRDLIYKNLLILTWLTIGLLVLIEYKIARIVIPEFHFNAPLSALGVLAVVGLLWANLLLSANFYLRFIGFVFPYFEFEGNLSKRRTQYRIPIAAAISVLYGAMILWLVAL